MRSLPSWQIPFLGVRHFPRSLTHFEIKTFFSFSEKERAAIRTRRGDELRLAFGIHLGFLKMTGKYQHSTSPSQTVLQVSRASRQSSRVPNRYCTNL